MQEYNFNGYNQDPYDDTKKRKSGWKYVLVAVAMLLVGALCMYFYMTKLWPSLSATQTQQNAQLPEQTPQPQAQNIEREVPALGAVQAEYVNPLNPVADIYENLSPSIVGVVVEKEASQDATAQSDSFGFAFDFGFGSDNRPATPQTYTYQASASGIILSEDGYIVTNNHVIENAKTAYVVLNGSTEKIPATIIGGDKTNDIAVIKIEKTGLKSAPVGDSSSLRMGELSVIIGNPYSAEVGTVTQGIISVVERELYVDGNSNSFIQTDAAMNPGNSGGALANSAGEVIGIVTLKTVVAGYDENGAEIAAEGIGFAIPINRAVGIVSQLIATGEVVRPGIGIMAHEITQEEADYNKVPMGILVYSVTQSSTAQAAGILQGDVITEIEGEKASSLDGMLALIQSKSVGDTMRLKIWRDGNESEVSVAIGNVNNLEVAQ